MSIPKLSLLLIAKNPPHTLHWSASVGKISSTLKCGFTLDSLDQA